MKSPVNTGLLTDIRRVGMPQRIEKFPPPLFVVDEEEKVSKVVLGAIWDRF